MASIAGEGPCHHTVTPMIHGNRKGHVGRGLHGVEHGSNVTSAVVERMDSSVVREASRWRRTVAGQYWSESRILSTGNGAVASYVAVRWLREEQVGGIAPEQWGGIIQSCLVASIEKHNFIDQDRCC